jgi:hypothetical protein
MIFRRVILLIVAVVASACSAVAPPSLPPLLRGATAKGGNGDLCELAKNPDAPGYAVSPELSKHLEGLFPPGTPEVVLITELRKQGFELTRANCPGNPAVRRAVIRIPDDRPFGYELFSDVYWTTDEHGRVNWTTGGVQFTGL